MFRRDFRVRSENSTEAFASILSAAALIEDDYRPRIRRVVKSLQCGSPAFELLRQVTDKIEPHFVSTAAFNAAFTGNAASVHQFFGAAVNRIETEQKWRILKELILGSCPQSALSSEEQLASMSKAKGETWINFVDRYCTTCRTNGASRETQVKTLFKKLPANLKKLIIHLSPQSTVADMSAVLRNASFWESGALLKDESVEDAMDIDLATEQANVATDGRVVGSDGKINFSAVTNAGRLMVGAREICKTSRREAMNMLRFLQRICSADTIQRRPQFAQRRGGGRRAFVAENSPCEMAENEEIWETLSEDGGLSSEANTLHAKTAKAMAAKPRRRVLKLGLVSQSHLGYPRKVDALVDTGAESSIISLALAKELGARIVSDSTRLMLAHGQATKVAGKCEIEVSLEKAHCQRFKMSCLVLPNPGYDLLLGLDTMADNQISAHPHSRSVSIRGRKIDCLFAGPKMDKDAANAILPEELARFTEKVDHLPGLKGDRMQVPLNRSVVLGPKESKMMKTPIVIPKSLVHKRTPIVAPSFSVHLGVQYADFSTLTLTNHREEPVRITGKTTIFEAPAPTGVDYVVSDCNGKKHQLRGNRRSFPRRQ